MTSRRLLDLLLHAALVAAPGCTCPDGRMEENAFAPREVYAAKIDACLADDVQCEALCRKVLKLDAMISVERCIVTSVSDDGASLNAVYIQPYDCIGGRRPDGFVSPACAHHGAGAWIARNAMMEAASVTAFARLVRELVRFGAPAELIAEARAAIADELVHAELTAELARTLGGMVEPPVITAAGEPPTLEQLALENAVEGQVAETFGALVATCQASTATHPDVRRVFGVLARDESRHAALAHQLGAWFESRLGWRERNNVAAARQRAVAQIIADGIGSALAPDERAVLGLPDPEMLARGARQLFGELATT